MKRIAIYTRCSTLDQSTDLQTRDINNLIQSKSDYQLTTHYNDVGQSGAKESRPELNQMLQDAKEGKFDVLIVWKLDRLARSLSHLVTIVNDLHRLGVGFVSLSDNIDFTTAQGKLMFHILGAMGEFERSLIIERTVAGLAVAKAKGKILGRRKERDDDLIMSLRQEGLSIRKIASQLGISKGKVQRAVEATNCTENPLKKAA